MANPGDAEKATAALNGTQLGGRTLNVNEARPKPERAGRGNDRGAASVAGRRLFNFGEILGAIMEKIVTCRKCRRTFKVSGPYSATQNVPQGITCPFCEQSNEVMWPVNTQLTTIPNRKAPESAA